MHSTISKLDYKDICIFFICHITREEKTHPLIEPNVKLCLIIITLNVVFVIIV